MLAMTKDKQHMSFKERYKQIRVSIQKKRRARKYLFPNPPILNFYRVAAFLGCIFLIFFLANEASENNYRHGSDFSTVSGISLSADVLEKIANDEKTETLHLETCQVDDASIERIAQIDHISSLWLTGCDGYSSLAPLAANGHIKDLTIEEIDSFNGDELMSVEFPHVTRLTFEDVNFTGSSDFLRHFPALESIVLKPGTGIPNIEFLESCPKVRFIRFDGVDLSGEKYEPLSKCANLLHVELSACNLETLSWVRDCPEISDLRVAKNSLTSIDGLQNVTEFFELDLRENQVSDLSPLAKCEIFSLNLANNNVTDLGPLQNMSSLRKLDVSDNEIDDAGARYLGNLTNLDELVLSGNKLTNIDFCEKLTQLRMLDVASNDIADIAELAACSSLVALDVSDNRISSLQPLENNHDLRYLVANDNAIQNLKGLGDKPDLESALLSNNSVTDISGLAGSVGMLRILDLGDNQVSDISVLSDFALEKTGSSCTLLLERNNVKDVSPLQTQRDWKTISLYGNPIQSTDFFAKESFGHCTAYVPYIDGFDFKRFMTNGSRAAFRFVGVPRRQQEEILSVLDEIYLSEDPAFISTEEADGEVRAVREEISKSVRDDFERAVY